MKTLLIKQIYYTALACTALMTGLNSCTDRYDQDRSADYDAIPICIKAGYPSQSRVSDAGFAGGDRLGIFVVDYESDSPGTLLPSGNNADNVQLVLNEENWRWESSVPLYFKDNKTPVDVYGYYPYFSGMDKVSGYEFSVQTDQNRPAGNNKMAGYEASDLLWAKAVKAMPADGTVNLEFRHLMSCISVTLTQGNGFDEGEWNNLEKIVYIPGLIRRASVDISSGEVKPTGDPGENHIQTYVLGQEYRAIVVPQIVEADKTLVGITVDGNNYSLQKSESLTYLSGKKYHFTIKVDRKQSTGNYSFTLTDESVTSWLEDPAIHDGLVREYLNLEVKEPGKLSEAIKNKGWNNKTVEALKLIGVINANDFFYMRDSMPLLNSLNMKEVKIKAADAPNNLDSHIPDWAFYNKSILSHIVLPDSLKSVGTNAFYGTTLIGSLIIPEGVTDLYFGAFRSINTLKGSLYLPSTLKTIGGEAFANCGFTSAINLPDGLTTIESYAFRGCENITGTLTLPESLREIGIEAFCRMPKIKGDIVLPQGIKVVSADAFSLSGFDGNIEIPEGVEVIESSAFYGLGIKGELKLPSTLKRIGRLNGAGAFQNTMISGKLTLPNSLIGIDAASFKNCFRLNDTLKIPDNVPRIGEEAFYGCTGIEALVLPEKLEVISAEAFAYCSSLTSIISYAKNPPLINESSFLAVPKNAFSVEVPKGCVDAYRAAPGWRDFARITEYRGFVCRPMDINALNKEHVEEIILNADGPWTVEYLPDWCTLSQTSGDSKTAIILTLKEMPSGQGNRSDSIVFKLQDSDYRTICEVSQYDYKYQEDEVITLQKASKGKGIDIMFLGDGFDAPSIASNSYLDIVTEQYGHFFNIEPYKTYKEYFNVYAAIALSQDTEINTISTYSNTRFNTIYGGCDAKLIPDAGLVIPYALNTGLIDRDRLKHSLFIVVPNSTDYGGATYYYQDGTTISVCSPSYSEYPNDTRGIIQHEAGGHGFGKLGDERITQNKFVSDAVKNTIYENQFKGWYQNISLNASMSEVSWSHLIYDNRYSDIVDIFEGGMGVTRGVFRSELNSCMNYPIPYYNTISRQCIVQRILESAGEVFTLEKFFEKDTREWGGSSVSRNMVVSPWHVYSEGGAHKMPVFVNERPSEK